MDKLARTPGRQLLVQELPELRLRHVQAGRGSGEFCDVCHEIVGARDIEYELRSTLATPELIRMHLTCYESWRAAAIVRARSSQQHAQMRLASQRTSCEFLRSALMLGHALLDCAPGGDRRRSVHLRARTDTVCRVVDRGMQHVRPDAARAHLAESLAALRERLAHAHLAQ
ncbi:MAG TPA: hypothetical protein VKT22_07885 [Steroidobacteraceae bacterium]|nr:hypothetical protein [Steroidobacteraceae bacterium]